MGLGLLFGVTDMFYNQVETWLHDTLNVLDAPELNAFKWFALCHVNYTSVIFKKGKRKFKKSPEP